MKRTNSFTASTNRFLAISLASCLALGPALTICGLLSVSAPAFAQKNVPQERIAEGSVVNKDGSPISGAVVYLKDSRSNTVKTYIADDDGHFRFGELSQDTDYELWAESNGVRSKSREISSFDNDNDFHFTLRINISKPASLDGPSIIDTSLIP